MDASKLEFVQADAFAHLRGKLAWPVGGKLVARFGETRAGGVKWDGVLVATERAGTFRDGRTTRYWSRASFTSA